MLRLTNRIMSILNWFVGTGENSGNEERDDGVGRSRSEKDLLASELMNAREENEQLRMRVMEARRIMETTESTPDTEMLQQQIESLKQAHADALRQYESEHVARLQIENERNEAQVALQQTVIEAKHARNSNSVMEQRAELAKQVAEEMNEAAMKIENEKDVEIVSNEKHIAELTSRMNASKVEQLQLKRELAACEARAMESKGNMNSVHTFSMDVMRDMSKRDDASV